MTDIEAPATLSKSQQAYQWLKGRIAGQQLAPGYRLVLGSIAAELGMSVVPVREAIRQLEAEGLVTFERNVGAHVSMVDENRYRASMQALSLIEAAATAMAADQLTAADLRLAREINERMRAQLVEVDRFDAHSFTTLNHQFHAVLYRRCPNPRLVELVESEWARLGSMRDSIFTFVPDRAVTSVAEHEEIVGAIERGGPVDDIEQQLRRHRTGTLQAFLSRALSDEAPEGVTA